MEERGKDLSTRDFTIINMSREDFVPNAPQICSAKLVAKGIIAVVAEIVKGGTIGYAVYLVPANIASWEGAWGYGLVGTAASLSGAAELIRRIPIHRSIKRLAYDQLPSDQEGRLSRIVQCGEATLRKTHCWIVTHTRTYHLTLESMVGSLIIGNYFSQLASSQVSALIIDTTVTLGASGLHLIARALENQNRLPAAFKYPFYIVFGGSLGLGIGNLLLANIEGFGVNVPTWGKALTLTGFGLPNVYAQLVPHESAKILRASFYGMGIAAFFAILAFDIIEDIAKSNDFSDTTFGLVYAVAVFLGIFSSLSHYFDTLRHQASAEMQTESFPINRPQVEILDDEPPEDQTTVKAIGESNHKEEEINPESPPSLQKSSALSKRLVETLHSPRKSDAQEASPTLTNKDLSLDKDKDKDKKNKAPNSPPLKKK